MRAKEAAAAAAKAQVTKSRAKQRAAKRAAAKSIKKTDQATPSPRGFVGNITDSVTDEWKQNPRQSSAKRMKKGNGEASNAASTPPRSSSQPQAVPGVPNPGANADPAAQAVAGAAIRLPHAPHVEPIDSRSSIGYGDAVDCAVFLSGSRPWKAPKRDLPLSGLLQVLAVRRTIDILIPYPSNHVTISCEKVEMKKMFAERAMSAVEDVKPFGHLVGVEWSCSSPQTMALWLARCASGRDTWCVPSGLSQAAAQRQIERWHKTARRISTKLWQRLLKGIVSNGRRS